MNRALRLSVILLIGLAACADDPVSPRPQTNPAPAFSVGAPGAHGMVVMTRNLYLGADIDPVLAIGDPNQIPIAIAQAWANVVATNFPARAAALADEIAANNPQLIGLQEAIVYRRQTPSDYVLGNTAVNASTVVYDFVAILLQALQARGLNYVVAARVVESDLEFPMYTGQGPLPFDDIRYTDHDVILARADVSVQGSFGQTYQAFVPLSVGGVPLRLLRGFVAVDAEVGKEEIRFVSTHLEIQTFRPVQEAQTNELLQWLESSSRIKLVVGDFNSAANPSAPAVSKTNSYAMIRAADFDDLWLRHNDANEGLTCCFSPDLMNANSMPDQRLDLIFLADRQGRGGWKLEVVGNEVGDRTPSGLWPSDHAGVIGVLHLSATGN